MPGAKVPVLSQRPDPLRYLVDTDWVIDYQHGRPGTVSRLDALLPQGVGISIVSLAELFEGQANSADPQAQERALSGFLAGVSVVPLDIAVCRRFAGERRRLRAEGNLIPDLDILIGCTALRHGLTLLSNNRRHFQRLQGLNIVSV